MNLLDLIDTKKSPAELLAPVKEQIEKALGHPVKSFSLGIDLETSEIHVTAEQREDRRKDKLICMALKTAIKMKLGKKSPEFKKVAIHCNENKVGLALYLKDGAIQIEQF